MQREKDYRSQKSLQDNWETKKLQMFVIVQSLVKSINETKLT